MPLPSAEAAKTPTSGPGEERILAIDCLPSLAAVIEARGIGPLVHARHDHLDARLLAKVDPGHVVAPLVAAGFDAIELCETLRRLGYRGRFSAFAGRLPNARTVLAELRAHCPEIRIDIVEVDGL
jgi:hypothetical protein